MKYYPLILLALAVVSCAPPYSAELNTSAGLAKQMTLLGTIGPVNSPDGDATTAIKFLPINPTATTTTLSQLTLGSGFLVSQTTGSESLQFAFQGSGGNVQTMGGGGGFSLSGADPNYPLYQYEVITTTTTANIIVFRLDGTSSSSFYQLFTADLGNGSFQSPVGQTPLNSIYGSQTPLAVQHLPLQAGDKFNFLFTDLSVNGSEINSLPGPSFGTGAILRTVTVPAGIRRMRYFRSPDDVLSYFGYNSGSQWLWSRWDGSSFISLTSVTHPIEALLTNGDLISTDGGTLRIYDSNGSPVSSLPLGDMQFCYEAYVGTTPYVFFSLSLEFPHQNWVFRVYAMPTSALRGLKG